MVSTSILLLLLTGAAFGDYRPASHRPAYIPSAVQPKVDDSPYLLPKTVVPSHYDLKLFTHIDTFDKTKNESFVFEGTVVITVNVIEDVDNIILHRDETITIQAASLQNKNSEDVPIVLKFDGDLFKPEYQQQTLSTGGKITKGEYDIAIAYSGKHGDDMRGFYRSTYDDGSGEKFLITTQFEANDARRAFPSFDEPEMKATYTITIFVANTLINDKGYSVLSNMPQAAPPVTVGDTLGFTFQESTVRVSSYLVAFIVSDFVSTDGANFTRLDGSVGTFKTFGRKSFITAGDGWLSQAAGPAAVEIISNLTQVDFPYPKIDQIGIPDFAAGAMENWGLTTYRERMLFFNASRNPTSTKQGNVGTSVHELAHQWFGDLVTLHWWSDIWLNEGFATFFEYHATERINKPNLNTSTWDIVGQMVTDELQAGAFVIDAESNTRPLTSDVYAPGDIDANFDDVSYAKGGSVLRMWLHTLGESNFYKGLNIYLNANRGDVGTPEKLLKSFEDAFTDTENVLDGKIESYFEKWHLQAGYPVLTVLRNDNGITISQERFFWSVPATPSDWIVPITYSTDKITQFSSTQASTFLTGASLNITLDSYEWIILNNKQTGYYRVNYEDSNWQKLAEVLDATPEKIDLINRAQIIDDVFSLARSTNNYTTYDNAFAILKYLAKEKELVPWKAAFNSIKFLYTKLANTEARDKLESLLLEILETPFNELTLNVNASDSHTRSILRSSIASWACKLGLDTCVDQAKEMFVAIPTRNVRDGDRPHPDVLSTIACTGVRNGGPEDWEAIWKEFVSTSDNAEQTLFLSTLGCTKNETILNTFLERTLNPDGGIRSQDAAAAFSAVHDGNPENVQVALKFLQNNLEKIAENYGGGLNPLGSVITGLAAKLGSDEDVLALTDLKKKIDESPNEKVRRATKSAEAALATVTSNNAWLQAKYNSISQWLDDNVDGSASTASMTSVALLLSILVALMNR